jgi:uncharacterized protein
VLTAVIADTHMPRGGRALPEPCVRQLLRADLVLHAGDVTGAAFFVELERLCSRVVAVRGNGDDESLQERLPESCVVEVGPARVALVHDPGPVRGREQRLVERFPGCDAVIFGHTHRPQAERVGAVWLLNPGSPTERRRSPFRSMLLLHATATRIRPELIMLAG